MILVGVLNVRAMRVHLRLLAGRWGSGLRGPDSHGGKYGDDEDEVVLHRTLLRDGDFRDRE